MDRTQLFIVNNLINFFYKIKYSLGIEGSLLAEGDTFFAGNHRCPDLTYCTDSQIHNARLDQDDAPQFVIEIISNNDQMGRVHAKMRDYRAANVKVTWHILPHLGEIHVYQGKNMTICMGDDVCSAESVVKGFALSVNEILK